MVSASSVKQFPGGRWILLLLSLLLLGCQSSSAGLGSDSHARPLAPAEASDSAAGAAKAASDATPNAFALRAGDRVKVVYNDLPTSVPPLEAQLPEDGKLTLHLNIEIEFIGKTKSQLEKEIRDRYIKGGFYKTVTIQVEVPVRQVSIGGEVKQPGSFAHPGDLTAVGLINMAGGLTEYASKTAIYVIRANGDKQTLNYKKARRDKKADIVLYPGDRVEVPRSPI